MMNLALKVAIVSSFVTAFVLHGGGAERPVAASEPATPAGPATAEESAASAARVTQTPARGSTLPPSPVSPALLGEIPETSQDLAASAFAAEVARLSSEADEVDRLWQVYKDECGVQVSRHYDFGREWFSIWDRAAEASVDAPRCGDGLRRVRQAGEKVGREILKARATARQGVLNRGTEIGMFRWNALQWPQFEEEGARHSPPAAPSVPTPARSADNQRSKRQTSAPQP
jgi:hypothetical protein